MNILYVASEVSPFCKTGGLADVAGSLPPALAGNGNNVSVILPLYHSIDWSWREQMTFHYYFYVRLAWRSLYCGVFSLERDGVTYYFVDNEQYFGHGDLYGHYEDAERFAFFSRAVTEIIPRLPNKPNVVHCNDWQTALVPIYIRDESARDHFYRDIRTVITIHNIEYQGRYGRETLGDLFGLHDGWYTDGTIAYDWDVNLLKGAMIVSDAVTTVSPTYAQELRHAFFAHGLEGTVHLCEGKMHGILNGIDMNRYNPKTDRKIAARFDPEHLNVKSKNKAALQETMGLEKRENVPIVAMVSRLVSHKGLDLVCEKLDAIMENDLQLAILGKGDKNYEDFFNWACARYPGRVAVYLGYSDSLSMNIYAGADFFLMPSKSEPCGLSQMIAMRYGAVPIVRETGGLRDTVHAYEAWNGSGNGFSFADYNAGDMCHVIYEAVTLYHHNRNAYRQLQKRGMTQDFSWTASAASYEEIYRSLLS